MFNAEEILAAEKDKEMRQHAIAFFKWNASKVSEYIDYMKRVINAEGISAKEQELNRFENGTIEERYNLFIQSQQP